MVQAGDIREHMEVRDSVGVHLGAVDKVEGDRVKLTRTGSGDGQHHYMPFSAVARVDEHVHLNATAAALGLVPVGAAGASGSTGIESPLPPVVNRAVAGAAPRRNFYLPWILGTVGLVLLLLLFRSCVAGKEADTVVAPAANDVVIAPATGTTAAPSPGLAAPAPAAVPGQATALSGLGGFLAGQGVAPQRFVFEQLNFDTGKSDIRAADQLEVSQLASTLSQFGGAHVRVVGYADARGASPANAALGKARAEAIKAALVAKDVGADRIETASGGEGDPVDSNATAEGQAANRRTEVIVTQR